MANRAYLLIDLKRGLEAERSEEIVRQVGAIDGADFVDIVDGPHDIIAMFEVPASVDPIADEVRAIEGVAGVEICRLLDIYKEW